MKIFSSLIAFVMVFACLSVAYADIAEGLGPFSHNPNRRVTAEIIDRGKLSIKINLPYECNYKYLLVDKNTVKEISSGKGNGTAGETVIESVDLSDRLSDGKNYFLLTIDMTDIQLKTRFGRKKWYEDVTWIKTIVVKKNSDEYNVRVYDGDKKRR